MSEVAVPLWLAVGGGALALWALYEHALMPLLRKQPISQGEVR